MSEILASPAFLAGALALMVLALVFVVLPLWRANTGGKRIARRRRALEELRDDLDPDDYRKQRAAIDREAAERHAGSGSLRGLTALIIIAVPLLTMFLYAQLGTPAGLEAQTGHNAQLREILGTLTRQVRSEPEDTEAWNRLGMIWKDMRQFPAAESAFRRVLYIDPENALARLELAETLLYASGRARLPEASRALLDQVLRQNPDNQKALWLAGLGAFHDGQRQRAIDLWTRLRGLLPPGDVRDQVEAQLARLTARVPDAAGAAADPPAPTGQSQPPNASAASIDVDIAMAPELGDRITGSETVFVFARAVNGPPAPLAVKRFSAAELPTRVTLTDNDAMAAGLSLSTFPSVNVSARVSRSGNAIAAPGDLQGSTGALTVSQTAQVEIVIDQVVQ